MKLKPKIPYKSKAKKGKKWYRKLKKLVRARIILVE
jgi:hypothetical protein